MRAITRTCNHAYRHTILSECYSHTHTIMANTRTCKSVRGRMRTRAGTTYAPDGLVLGPGSVILRAPASTPCLLHAAQCAALCNDSQVYVVPKTGARVGSLFWSWFCFRSELYRT